MSIYDIESDGELELKAAIGAVTKSAPTDIALSRGSRFLYVLDSKPGTLSAFAVRPDGTLRPIGGASGLGTSAVGLAAR